MTAPKAVFICDACEAKDYNEIERLLCFGISLTRAKTIVAGENKAYCLCCGDYMPRATIGRHYFCTKKSKCRTAARRLKYYRQMLGMSKEEALEKTLRSLVPKESDEEES